MKISWFATGIRNSFKNKPQSNVFEYIFDSSLYTSINNCMAIMSIMTHLIEFYSKYCFTISATSVPFYSIAFCLVFGHDNKSTTILCCQYTRVSIHQRTYKSNMKYCSQNRMGHVRFARSIKQRQTKTSHTMLINYYSKITRLCLP